MRIASPQLGLSPQSVLGGEVFDREILLGLAKAGIEVEIILPKGKHHDKNIKNWKINYLLVSHFPPQLFNFLIVPYLFKINHRSKIDIIRLHQPQFTALGSIFFRLLSPKVKTVATYHKFEETNFGLFSRGVNNFWDHIICDSQYVKDKLIATYQIKSSKITVVHNGVPNYLKPTKKDPALVKKLKLGDKTVLLFMGLFIERKNPLFLLDLLKKLPAKTILIYLGNGPLKNQIVSKAKELGISKRVLIIEPVFDKEKIKIHNLADIFVHPSKDEGFALAPLEAMACAKPVVMTDGYSAKEAVDDGINGFLCRSNDLNHWNEKLTRLINDPQLRNKMGGASLKKAKKEFQWNLAVQKHLKVFKYLTNETN